MKVAGTAVYFFGISHAQADARMPAMVPGTFKVLVVVPLLASDPIGSALATWQAQLAWQATIPSPAALPCDEINPDEFIVLFDKEAVLCGPDGTTLAKKTF